MIEIEFDAFLFDLDGTLLNFEQETFVKTYLGTAAIFFKDLIPNPEMFYKELLSSTDIMENNDNDENTALQDFLEDFCPKFDVSCNEIKERFIQFYQTEFKVIQPLISEMNGARKILYDIKKYFPKKKLILATNPVFPFIAVRKRMEWGGVPEEVFDLITHAENTNYCKNNSKYWIELANRTSINPEKSLMIGNDGYRDMIAKKYGYKTFLIDTVLENEEYITDDIIPDYRGTLEDLSNFLFS